MINRGWVQDRIQSPIKRHNAQIEGVVEINGVVRLTEQRQQFAPKHRILGDKWQYRYYMRILRILEKLLQKICYENQYIIFMVSYF